MAQGLYTHRTRNAGEIVTDVLYNTAHENQLQNDVPNEAGGLSDDSTEYRATQDPAPGGVVNQVASILEEFQQLRFALADIKTALNGGVPLAQWYTPVTVTGATVVGRGARVFRNANQSISFKTPTAVVFDTVRYDTGVTDPGVDPFFSLGQPTRLTAKAPGLYQFNAFFQWNVGASGPVAAFIRYNGTKLLAASEWVSDGVQTPWLAVSTQYMMAQDDYVELVVFQTVTNPFSVINPEFGLELLNPSPSAIPPPATHTLMISESGTGSGTVTSDVGPINCPGVCSASYADGSMVTLAATPTVGGFVHWTGDVPGSPNTTNPITVTMDQARSIDALFTAFTLNISEAGTGSGIVTSDIGSINCPGVCSDLYAPGDVVQLTATPTVGAFTSWTGDLTSTSNPDSITMDADKTVVATFTMTGVLAAFNNSVGPFTGTRYASLTSDMQITSTAAGAAVETAIVGTFTKLYVILPAVLAGGHTLDFQLNINGSDTGAILSMVAGDQAKSVTLAVAFDADDQVALKVVQNGGGGDTLNAFSLAYVPV